MLMSNTRSLAHLIDTCGSFSFCKSLIELLRHMCLLVERLEVRSLRTGHGLIARNPVIGIFFGVVWKISHRNLLDAAVTRRGLSSSRLAELQRAKGGR